MKKKELLERIKELEEEQVFKNAIIEKLLRDFIMIKPTPKGNIKERIVVFEGNLSLSFVDITADMLLFLEKLRLDGKNELMFTSKNL
jgi:hypothetical protein